MVEQVGVGAVDFRGHGFQRYRLRPLFEQELPRRGECGGSALFRAKAGSSY